VRGFRYSKSYVERKRATDADETLRSSLLRIEDSQQTLGQLNAALESSHDLVARSKRRLEAREDAEAHQRILKPPDAR
jgi:hypothetical protein